MSRLHRRRIRHQQWLRETAKNTCTIRYPGLNLEFIAPDGYGDSLTMRALRTAADIHIVEEWSREYLKLMY